MEENTLKKWLEKNNGDKIEYENDLDDIESIELYSESNIIYEWYNGCCGSYLIDIYEEGYYENSSYDEIYIRDKNMSIDDLLESKRNK